LCQRFVVSGERAGGRDYAHDKRKFPHVAEALERVFHQLAQILGFL
jgi:hypothetical protein